MSLYEMVEPKCSLKELVLPEKVLTAIRDLLEDHEYQEALTEEGLTVRKKILLHGPPGCGKTSIAHAIAKEMGTKLYAASLAQAVGSHVGQSEKNIESLFKFASQNRVVLLLDEFDSISSARFTPDSSADLSNNRTVNTLLTCLEGHPPLGLIFAATNLIDFIDPAILRRFDFIIEVPQADRSALKKIANAIIRNRFGISVDEILAEATTPAAVVRLATDRLRRKVIDVARLERAQTASLFSDNDRENAKQVQRILKGDVALPIQKGSA